MLSWFHHDAVREVLHTCGLRYLMGGSVWALPTLVPPPPLHKLQPCPGYSGHRDRINLGPHLIWYKCSAAT